MNLDKFTFGTESPATSAFAITPSDSTNLTQTTRAIYIGSAGNLKVLMLEDSTPVTFTGLVEGTLLPICVKRVYETDTTASNIIGLY